MNLRVLHPSTDEHLFREAWRWRLEYPRLVRRWDGLKHFKQWFALMRRRVSIGIFTDHLIAIATLKPDGNGVYEAHVDCERRVDLETLTTALLNIEKTCFEEWGAREIFAGIIAKNYGIIQLAELCGFQRDGIEDRIGRLRWVRMRITDVEYQNQFRVIEQHSYIREAAGSGFTGHQDASRHAI